MLIYQSKRKCSTNKSHVNIAQRTEFEHKRKTSEII